MYCVAFAPPRGAGPPRTLAVPVSRFMVALTGLDAMYEEATRTSNLRKHRYGFFPCQNLGIHCSCEFLSCCRLKPPPSARNRPIRTQHEAKLQAARRSYLPFVLALCSANEPTINPTKSYDKRLDEAPKTHQTFYQSQWDSTNFQMNIYQPF